MISRKLEFRGINRRSLEAYFEELGGKRRQKASVFESENANDNYNDNDIDIVIDINIDLDNASPGASAKASANSSANANSKLESDGFLAVFVGDGWEGQILSEEEISFTTVIKVNAVHVRFLAEDEAGLAELIKKYRYKTTRVGG